MGFNLKSASERTAKFVVFAAICTSLTQAALGQPGSAPLTNKRKGYWDIAVRYPTFLNRSVTATKANAITGRRAASVYSDFLARAKKEVPPLKKDGMAAEYSIETSPTVTYDTAAICSGFISGYIYTGGAHGTSYFEAFNVLPDGSTLKLQDLFDKYTDGKLEVSKAIVEQLLASGEGAWVQDGGWTELSDIQAKNFVVTPGGLTFLFGSYELGSYAEGTFKITVPFQQLQGLNRGGRFGNILSKTAPSIYGTTWKLDQVAFNDDTILKPEPGSRYELNIDSSGRVTGIAGTNRIMGNVVVTGQRLKFGPLATTRMADLPKSIAPRYLKSLQESTSFLFDKGKLALQLPYDSGVIIFRRG